MVLENYIFPCKLDTYDYIVQRITEAFNSLKIFFKYNYRLEENICLLVDKPASDKRDVGDFEPEELKDDYEVFCSLFFDNMAGWSKGMDNWYVQRAQYFDTYVEKFPEWDRDTICLMYTIFNLHADNSHRIALEKVQIICCEFGCFYTMSVLSQYSFDDIERDSITKTPLMNFDAFLEFLYGLDERTRRDKTKPSFIDQALLAGRNCYFINKLDVGHQIEYGLF